MISAVLKDNSLPAVAVRLVGERGALLKSAETERQLFDVVARPSISRRVAPAARDWLLSLLDSAETVEIAEAIVACRDPTDDKFLELAVNGRADVIVTGDADLLVLDPFGGIPIVKPAAFVQSA